MKKYKFEINTKFPTLNEYIKIERGNKYSANSFKKNIENKIIYISKNQRFKLPENTKFDVSFFWILPNNRTDHDNIAFAKKFIFDALQKAHILQNDSPKIIRNFKDFFEVRKETNYIFCIVIFEEI